jgi:hypothetical protein
MTRLTVNSSDLATARAAAAGKGLEPGTGTSQTGCYLRFHADALLPGQEHAPARVAAPEEPGAVPWPVALRNCLERTRGAGVLVMDESALIVASAGSWMGMDEAQLEAIGPRLNAALDQAEYIEGTSGPSRAVAVQTGTSWLTGIHIPLGEGGTLTVGVIAADPLSRDLQDFVADQVRRTVSA